MEKGIYYDNETKPVRGVYYDNFEIKESLPGEHWLPVFESVVEDVKHCYYISDKGRLYSTVYKNGKGGFKFSERDNNTYLNQRFATNNGYGKSFMQHRLVMMEFNPIPNPDDYYVNHIDGNKLNNDISNLEWCTQQQNIRHAFDTGLIHPSRGENHHCATHDEALIHKICEGLEKGLSIPDCAVYAGLEPTRDNRRYISRIKREDIWTHISSQYNIPKDSYGYKSKFTDNEVHKICWDIQDGLSNVEILDKIRPGLTGPDRYKMYATINRIRIRKTHQDITKYYEF